LDLNAATASLNFSFVSVGVTGVVAEETGFAARRRRASLPFAPGIFLPSGTRPAQGTLLGTGVLARAG
jgi:hypothetical protein